MYMRRCLCKENVCFSKFKNIREWRSNLHWIADSSQVGREHSKLSGPNSPLKHKKTLRKPQDPKPTTRPKAPHKSNSPKLRAEPAAHSPRPSAHAANFGLSFACRCVPGSGTAGQPGERGGCAQARGGTGGSARHRPGPGPAPRGREGKGERGLYAGPYLRRQPLLLVVLPGQHPPQFLHAGPPWQARAGAGRGGTGTTGKWRAPPGGGGAAPAHSGPARLPGNRAGPATAPGCHRPGGPARSASSPPAEPASALQRDLP